MFNIDSLSQVLGRLKLHKKDVLEIYFLHLRKLFPPTFTLNRVVNYKVPVGGYCFKCIFNEICSKYLEIIYIFLIFN